MRGVLTLMAVAVGLRLFFWIYTGRTWEDALITVLHSENFAAGLGLTHYKTDEGPIHGFTSPLSVLVPLAGELIQVGLGLPLLKVASALAGAAAVLLAWLLVRERPELGSQPGLIFLPAGYLAVEHHQILWGMAGMETQMATAALLGSVYCLQAGSPAALGASLALCLLARPDFVLWVALAGLILWVRAVRSGSWSGLFRAAGTATILYGPWLVFTTLYYGSPIPNTILAKSAAYGFWWRPHLDPSQWLRLAGGAWRVLTRTLFAPLGPAYGGNSMHDFLLLADQGWIARVMQGLLCLGAAVALRRRQRELYPLYGVFALYVVYYLFVVPALFLWYCVPLAGVAILLCAKGAGDLLACIRSSRLRAACGWVLTSAYLLCLIAALPTTFAAERGIQQVIEEPVRASAGRFLRERAQPHQTIGSESLGYLGYYSRRHVYDYPGLTSRRVVAFVKANPGGGLFGMLEAFRPDYLVLRRHEYEGHTRLHPGDWLAREYQVLRRFRADYEDLHSFPFAAYNVDTDFYVLGKL
jgi:hypothetical protein